MSKIRITNPLPGFSPFTSIKRAERYIRADRARWANSAHTLIEINSDHHACKSALRSSIEVPIEEPTEDPVFDCMAAMWSRVRAERMDREKNAIGQHSVSEWQDLLAKFGNRCLRCGISGVHVSMTRDHIVPLIEGGTNYISNIQPLCRRCNSWKGNREIDFRNRFIARVASPGSSGR